MKQTPFYEISVALQGRPRMFRLLVIIALHLSFLVLLQSFSNAFQHLPEEDTVTLDKKKAPYGLSAKAERSAQYR